MTRELGRLPAGRRRATKLGPAIDERGATATEYAILLGFIAVVIGFAIAFFGSNLNAFFNAIGSSIGSYL
jgi:pilus assembly protein Flp/PilA